MKWLIFLISVPLLLTAIPVEKGINCALTIDLQAIENKSKLDFSPCFLIPNGTNSIMFSPRASVYYNQTFDINFGVGYRIPLESFTVGSHIFWDFTQTPTCFLFQNGISFELLSDSLDTQINYYHPLIYPDKPWDYKFPENRIELDTVYKFESFGFGASSSYRFVNKVFETTPKIILPIKGITFETGLVFSNKEKPCAVFSFSIPIMMSEINPVRRPSQVPLFINESIKKKQ